MQRSTNRRITVQACPGIKRDPISKITNAERAGGVSQMVEHPPSKCKALTSKLYLGLEKRKKKKKKTDYRHLSRFS
jgi:hypothetical protein